MEKKLSLEERELLRLLQSIDPERKDVEFDFSKDLDFKRFLEVVAEQGIFPFIGVLLENKNEVPDRVRMTFFTQNMIVQDRQRKLRDELQIVATQLNKRGITPIVLKGFSFLEKYPDPLMRISGDFDLMVKREDVYVVDEVLCSLGYGMEEYGTPFESEHGIAVSQNLHHLLPYCHSSGRGSYMIEVHQPQTEEYSYFGIDEEEMNRKSVPLEGFSDVQIARYNDLDLLIYACIHFFRHAQTWFWAIRFDINLRLFLDVFMIAHHISKMKDGWRRFVERAEQVNAVRICLFTLIRVRLIWPNVCPDWVIEELSGKTFPFEPPFALDWNLKHFQVTYFERLFRAPESFQRMEETISSLRDQGLVCGVVEKNVPIKIDEDDVPEWQFFGSHQLEIRRPPESKLEATFDWDEDYFYGSFLLEKPELICGTDGLIWDKIRVLLYEPPSHRISIYPKARNKVGVEIIKMDGWIISHYEIGDWSQIEDNKWQLKVRIPWEVLDYTPQSGDKRGFNMEIWEYKEPKAPTLNVLSWSGGRSGCYYGTIKF